MSNPERGIRLTGRTPGEAVMEPDPILARVASYRRSPGARALLRATRLAALVPLTVGVVWAGGCHEDRIGGPELPDTTTTLLPVALAMVSDPIRVNARASSGTAAAGRGASQADEVFVSLPPGAVPNGVAASVRNPRTESAVSVAMTDGGFDPVVVAASAGDNVEIEIRMAGGGSPVTFALAVPLMRRPAVVRTEPPPRKRDVALNARMIIVFSEPVAGTTLTPGSVQLLRGTTPVVGTVSLLDVSGIAAVFTPSAPLEANTDYQLIVAPSVQDLSGDVLQAGVTVEFTTGQSFTGPAASLQLSPNSVTNLLVRLTYTLRATVRDRAGNTLTGEPVSWTSSDPAVATVAPADSNGQMRGRVTAVSAGTVTITATSGTVSGTATVTVFSPAPNPVAFVTLAPESLTLPAQDLGIMTVTLRDANGREIGDFRTNRRVVTLTSSNQAVLPVPNGSTLRSNYCGFSSEGYLFCPGWNVFGIRGVAEGSAMLIATSEGVSDTAVITVGPPRAVASVTFRLARSYCFSIQWDPSCDATAIRTRLLLQGVDTLMAILRDANGTEITAYNGGVRAVAWAGNTGTGVVSVDTARTAELRPRFGFRETAIVTALSAGTATVTAAIQGVSGSFAVEVPPLLTFTSLATADAGYLSNGAWWEAGHTCGLTANGTAYCWGSNGSGELGDGTFADETWTGSAIPIPGPVSGALTFASLSAGSWYTCGVTTTNAGYCWGWGRDGQLGNGADGYSATPQLISGGLSLAAISTGYAHACGLTTAGQAYCWGANWVGQLGDGTTSTRMVPAAVAGALPFVTVTAGHVHSCGLTAAGTAYCWGSNAFGELGDGTTTSRLVPTPVSGGLSFVAIEAGYYLTCGLTAGGVAYCWGRNLEGAVGDGTTTNRSNPTPVSGGRSFASLTVGRVGATACARTGSGEAFCWGGNSHGQLGDGTTANRSVPTRVTGGLSFASLSAGGYHACGLTTASVAYCWGSNASGALGDMSAGIATAPVRVVSQP